MKGAYRSPRRPVSLVSTLPLLCSLMLIITMVSTSPEEPPSICQLACKTSMNGTATENFCNSHPELYISGRCCFNMTESSTTVLGIDLQDCSLTALMFSEGIVNMNKLQYISLEGNELNQLHPVDFHQNTDIIYLSLPPNLSCPGSNNTWLTESSDANQTFCFDEQNTCDVHNVTCPSNSHCVHSGLDLAECLCDEGYHGYKCLEQGVFPLTSFLIGTTVSTVILCIFFYVTQRRHVVQQNRKGK